MRLVEDMIARGWEQLVGRDHGPLTFRLVVQPLVAVFFALRSGLRDAVLALPVTEEYIGRNQGTTVDEAMALVENLALRARDDGCRLTVILAVAFGCPFSGVVSPDLVLSLAERAVAAGASDLCLADTIGVAVPRQVRPLVKAVDGLGLRVVAEGASK